MELGTGDCDQESRVTVATVPRKKLDDIFSRLDTIQERDRQTDRHLHKKRPRLRIASRGTNGVTRCKQLAVPVLKQTYANSHYEVCLHVVLCGLIQINFRSL